MGLSADLVMGIPNGWWPALVGLVMLVVGLVVPGARTPLASRYPVQVADLWDDLGVGRFAGGTFVVVRPNVGTEAGPDSWVMAKVEQVDGVWVLTNPKRIRYMHRRDRLKGEWRRRETTVQVYRPLPFEAQA